MCTCKVSSSLSVHWIHNVKCLSVSHSFSRSLSSLGTDFRLCSLTFSLLLLLLLRLWRIWFFFVIVWVYFTCTWLKRFSPFLPFFSTPLLPLFFANFVLLFCSCFSLCISSQLQTITFELWKSLLWQLLQEPNQGLSGVNMTPQFELLQTLVSTVWTGFHTQCQLTHIFLAICLFAKCSSASSTCAITQNLIEASQTVTFGRYTSSRQLHRVLQKLFGSYICILIRFVWAH